MVSNNYNQSHFQIFFFIICCSTSVTHHVKSRLCRQKSKFVLFSHTILWCKTFRMSYYLWRS